MTTEGRSAYLALLDNAGNILREEYPAGALSPEMRSVVTLSNGFFAAGREYHTETGYDARFIQLSPDLQTLADSTYSRPGTQYINRLVPVVGGVLGVGAAVNDTLNTLEGWAVFLDDAEQPIWECQVTGMESGEFTDAVPLPEGGYLLFGNRRSGGEYDWWTVRIDGNGDYLGETVYSFDGQDQATRALLCPDGSIDLCGSVQDGLHGSNDLMIRHIALDGSEIWMRQYGSTSMDVAKDAICLGETGVLLIGSKTGPDGILADYYLLAADAEGNSIWSLSLGTMATDIPDAACLGSDGNWTIVGHSLLVDPDDSSPYIIRMKGLFAAFTVTPQEGAAPLTCAFIDRSYPPEAVRNWDFDNDGEIDSSTHDPVYIYTIPEFYNPRLLLEWNGYASEETGQVNVLSGAPPTLVSFEPADSSITVFEDSEISFSIEISDPDSTPLYRWECDGSIIGSDLPNCETTFSEPGEHDITVTIVSGLDSLSCQWHVRVEELGIETSTSIGTFGWISVSSNQTLAFYLSEMTAPTIRIYDIRGRRVRTILPGQMATGRHQVQWDGRNDRGRLVGEGVYLYRLDANFRTCVRRGVRLR
jgi:PKD repeat protein